jgi:hypothetical protein
LADVKAILTERIAKYVHDQQWVPWAKAIMENEPISVSRRERWSKLFVPYEELSEAEKDKDRVYAKGIMNEISKEVEDGDYLLSVLP